MATDPLFVFCVFSIFSRFFPLRRLAICCPFVRSFVSTFRAPSHTRTQPPPPNDASEDEPESSDEYDKSDAGIRRSSVFVFGFFCFVFCFDLVVRVYCRRCLLKHSMFNGQRLLLLVCCSMEKLCKIFFVLIDYCYGLCP